MIIEISVLLIALAFVAIAVYVVLLLKKISAVTDEAQQTLMY